MNRIYSVAVAAGFLAAGIVLPTPARAQDIGPVFDMGALTNTLSQSAVTQSEERRAARLRGGSARSTTKNASTGRAAGTFTPSAAVRKRVVDALIAKARTTNPQGAAELQQILTTQNPFGVIEKWMARYGLKTNRVADAMATYLVVAWNGARGSNDDPQKAQIIGVRDQFSRALGSTAAFARLPDAKKQELADTLLLNALIYDASVGAAKKKPETMPQVRATIAKGAQAILKLDVNAFQLTNAGLRRG